MEQGKAGGAARGGAGDAVLDAGCGRGETALAIARTGAEVAGIDYSEAAVELTKEMLAEIQPDADIRSGSVTDLPWPDDSFDRIQFSDVIEHLDPPQTVPALAEFRRVLKPGGFLLVHTAPNLLFMNVGWPAARPFVRLAGHREIADRVDGWFEIAEDYHVNEQSVFTLRRNLRAAGFAARTSGSTPTSSAAGASTCSRDSTGPPSGSRSGSPPRARCASSSATTCSASASNRCRPATITPARSSSAPPGEPCSRRPDHRPAAARRTARRHPRDRLGYHRHGGNPARHPPPRRAHDPQPRSLLFVAIGLLGGAWFLPSGNRSSPHARSRTTRHVSPSAAGDGYRTFRPPAARRRGRASGPSVHRRSPGSA